MSQEERARLIKEANEDRERRHLMTPEERRNAIKYSALKVLDDFLAMTDLDRTLYCYRGRIVDWRVHQQSLPLFHYYYKIDTILIDPQLLLSGLLHGAPGW